MSSTAAEAGTARAPMSRLWDRELHRYPDNATRYVSLGIVVLTTILLYYQLYLAGGVATAILRDLHMSFVYFVNITVIGYVLGAAASVLAGLADRYGRANIVTAGLLVTGLLCTFALPNVHSQLGFGIVYVAIGFVEGIILVATPALVRDFSPQLGRASAMGFWTLGPVLGSLVVSAVVSSETAGTTWQHQYLVSGIAGLVVFAIALVGLRELSPRLRDQLMVSHHDRALIEARAQGIDIQTVLRHPWRQMLRVDILGSAFAISVFLIIYYLAVGFFPTFFQTVFGYTQARANALGNWFWSFNAGALLIVGLVSDRVRVRKPFMVLGAVGAIVFTTIFALRTTHPETSYTTFVVLLSLIAVSLGTAFAPWMASFTETVERRNPALIATGLAVWGLIIRLVIAVSVFFVPKVVDTVTTLVEKGPVVQEILADPTPVGATTIGQVATATAEHPAVVARLKAIGPAPQSPKDKAYVATVAAKQLGPANLAALAKPTPELSQALKTLSVEGPPVAKAAAESPKQWRTYFFVGVAGEVVFIPLILLMAGFWDPRAAKRAEEAHEAFIAAEMAKLKQPQAAQA
jgi:ACS family D-galactonate transporter-like MFS transporter